MPRSGQSGCSEIEKSSLAGAWQVQLRSCFNLEDLYSFAVPFRFYARFYVDLGSTCNLHCSSRHGLPYRILNINMVKPKRGTAMDTI